ncbi:Iron(III) ABC transporter permease protein [Candidatus Methylomirabilis oxygeniifera]|uniref:Iron(III) ABC transporter permease protein n=1 Tax=Methylomirabilis oxygeniifera TaxID=671143 RepID=D5MLS4_METO1|nr:Iron(III) ABC transporter permease protein [Candidatus Methylomirabilis oxyfera]
MGPGPAAVAGTVLIILLTASPLAALLISVFAGGIKAFSILADSSILLLIGRTMLLAALATLWAMILGLPPAWILTRTDLPGRRILLAVAVLPLAIPPYIGAFTYITLLGPVGWANTAYQAVGGSGPIVNIYGLWGGVFVLGLFTYPYILLMAGSALKGSDPALEEAARAVGLGPIDAFRRVTLPLLRPSLLAGALLVFLYALSDFGAVSLLRVNTFTTEIFHQLNTRFDQRNAAVLSTMLILITAIVLMAQRGSLGRRSFVQRRSGVRPPTIYPLGRWKLPALCCTYIVLGASVFLPVTLLFYQTGSPMSLLYALIAGHRFLWNSLWTATVAATVASGLGLFVAYLALRRPGPAGLLLTSATQLGYAIPGTVLGLSLILLYNAYLPWVYGTAAMVILGYLLRFLPQAVQGNTAALVQVDSSLEEAARSLGRSDWQALREVTFPLIRPGIAAGWMLVFISSMKELAATLLLRPAGFDTLPVRIWIASIEVDYAGAAATSLILIAITAVPLFLITRRDATLSQLD